MDESHFNIMSCVFLGGVTAGLVWGFLDDEYLAF